MSAIQNLQPFGEALCALGPGERAGPAPAPPRGAVAIPGPVASAAGGWGRDPTLTGRRGSQWRGGRGGMGAGPAGAEGRDRAVMGGHSDQWDVPYA